MKDNKSQLFIDLITQYLIGNYKFLENYNITYFLDDKMIDTISSLEYLKKFHLNGNCKINYDIKIKRR